LGSVILLLLGDDRVAREASPESASAQQVMKIDKSRKGSLRRTEVHAGAHDRIEHPRRQHQDRSRTRHDMDETACLAQLDRLHAQSLAMQRMPTVVNDSFLPDMGRMTG
jgi:hypothetical protein